MDKLLPLKYIISIKIKRTGILQAFKAVLAYVLIIQSMQFSYMLNF